MRTGILYGSTVRGLVPELEEREAAIFAGYRWREWLDLPRYERVDGVAHFRLHHLIELHGQDAVAEESRRAIARRTLRHR